MIDDYQKGGIVIDNDGSDARIQGNKITGIGLTPVIAQSGIQVSNGATADIVNNEISRNLFKGSSASSAGILLFESGRTKITNNELTRNDVGIDVLVVDQTTEISHNEISLSTDYGIILTTSTKIEISNNQVTQSGFEGIFLTEGSNANKVSQNTLERNGLDGIHVENSNNNRITENKLERNGRDGIRVSGTSSGNRLTFNNATKNVEHDCHDETFGGGTAGTANFWKNNFGKTENRPGLCD